MFSPYRPRPRLRLRTKMSALAVVGLVAAALLPTAPAGAHFAAGYAYERNRLGEVCGSYRSNVGGYYYSGRPCSINFTKSSLLSGYGWSTAADAASGNWNGHVDPDRGEPVFGFAGYVSGPQQVYMGVRDLGSSTAGVRLGTTRTTSDCSSYCRLDSSTIEMTNNAAARWYVNSGDVYTVPSDSADWQSVATHELGHAMGLLHQQETWDPTHTMGACASRGARRHTGSHDREGMFFAYGGRENHWPRVAALGNC